MSNPSRRAYHQLGHSGDITDAEVETLAGNRVYEVGGLADERLVARGIALGQDQPQRVDRALACRLDRTEEVAKTRRKLGR